MSNPPSLTRDLTADTPIIDESFKAAKRGLALANSNERIANQALSKLFNEEDSRRRELYEAKRAGEQALDDAETASRAGQHSLFQAREEQIKARIAREKAREEQTKARIAMERDTKRQRT